MSLEPIGISPRIDCVFKELMGNPENADLLLDFLNAILQPEVPFVSVVILNPQHSPLFLSGKSSVLDIKAVDAAGTLFQIEMQNWNMATLPPRMVFNNAEMFSRQGSKGQDYTQLKPAISIWILNQTLFPNSRSIHHGFQLYDAKNGRLLSSLMQIHTLELERWRQGKDAGLGEDTARWMEFFAAGETWGEVPEHLASPMLEKAMDILKQFKHNADWYRIYGSEEEALSVKITEENEYRRTRDALNQTRDALNQTQDALNQTQQDLDAARRERESALAEVTRLRLLLHAASSSDSSET